MVSDATIDWLSWAKLHLHTDEDEDGEPIPANPERAQIDAQRAIACALIALCERIDAVIDTERGTILADVELVRSWE